MIKNNGAYLWLKKKCGHSLLIIQNQFYSVGAFLFLMNGSFFLGGANQIFFPAAARV